MRTNGQTNMTKLIVAFRNLAKVPKNDLLYVPLELVICNHSQQILLNIYSFQVLRIGYESIYIIFRIRKLLRFSYLRSVRDSPVRILSIAMTVIQFNMSIHIRTHKMSSTDDVREMKLTTYTVSETQLQVFWGGSPYRLAFTSISKERSACTCSTNCLPGDTALHPIRLESLPT